MGEGIDRQDGRGADRTGTGAAEAISLDPDKNAGQKGGEKSLGACIEGQLYLPVHIMKIRFILIWWRQVFLRLSGRKFLFSCLPGKWKGEGENAGEKVAGSKYAQSKDNRYLRGGKVCGNHSSGSLER